MADKPIKLNENQVVAVNFIEQTYWLEGSVPSTAKIADVVGLKEPTIKNWFKEGTDFQKVLQMKNLIPKEKHANVLTAQQLMVVNMLLNLSDPKSEREKLEQCSVSTAQYQAWRRDPNFLEYMHRRARDVFDNAEDIASQALLRNLKMGDQSAIKFYYEVTGRYNPRLQVDVNVENVMVQVVQVIQEELSEYPELMLRIADRLSLLAGDAPPPRPQLPTNFHTPQDIIETDAMELRIDA